MDLRTGKIIVALALTALVSGLPSCSTSGCLDNQSAIPLAEFYSSATGQAVTLNLLTVRGLDAPGDSALLAAPSSASQVYLPMRSSRTSTSWVLSYAQEGIDSPEFNDTVSLDYDSEPYFASSECGAMYNYRLRSVRTTTHLLDSVSVVDSLITNVDRAYLKFYFRTAEAPEEGDEE